MTKLKLGPIVDDKPVKVTIELPAPLHRDLVAYAAALGREQGQTIGDPTKLIVPMLERFIATCAFHVMVGTVSIVWWAVIPRDRGQSLHRMVGAHST